MDYYNFAIVGSGPSGVAAARRLENKGTCIIDVGDSPKQEFPYSTLLQALESGNIEALLGSKWEMLANIHTSKNIHPKLKAPCLRHVANGEPFNVYDGKDVGILKGFGSYAAGGMSNAWGAQLFRYTEADLADAGNWPIGVADLNKYYLDLEKHIGIAGTKDDMSDFLGKATCLLPPTPLVPSATYLLSRYARHKANFRQHNLTVGRSRLALLTQQYHGYPAYHFNEIDFFSTGQPGIYTARRTLDELCSRNSITYLGGHKLIAYREFPEYVEIDLNLDGDSAIKTIRARHLLLGCGTLHTTRMVLHNKNEIGRQLPFIDHPPSLLPLFIPKLFGSTLPSSSFPVQLTTTFNCSDYRDMISLYYPGALLWSDLLTDVPIPIDSTIRLLGSLISGMLVAQIWVTSHPTSQNNIQLESDGSLRINYPYRPPYPRIQNLIKGLRPLGAYTIQRLASTSPPGWGFHYAASLPMKHHPKPYETHTDGRLWDSMRIRVIDGSVLPSLPAKNHSLTLMANAARIANETLKCGY